MSGKLSARTIHLTVSLCLIAVVLASVISTRAASREQSKAAPAAIAKATAAKAGDDYVGSDTCLICHADQGKHFQNTVMGKAFAHPKMRRKNWAVKHVMVPAKPMSTR